MPNANEYMLKQADAEAIYQKKLNAGTGINIDPITDTISATGSGGSTVTYTPNITAGTILGVLGINGNSNPIKSPSLIAGQNVTITQDPTTGALTFSSVNTTYNDMVGADGTNPGTHGLAPAPAATDNTKFFKGDGTWGDPVTPNPSATATATLSKLSINNTVYDLAGGTTTYLGTTDPSNSLGNNGDLYFKYTSVPAVIEDEVTLPTFVDDQSTHITVPHFEDYIDVSFGYIDANHNPGTKNFTIEDLPQNNDPQWSQGGDIYIMNGYYYAVASRDSTGFWIKECGNPLQSITVSYSGYSYSIVSTYVKIEGRWNVFSTGGGTDVEANPSGSATNTLTKLRIDDTIYGISGEGANVSELTQSQYNALTPAEKTNGSIYMTHDGGESNDQTVRMTSNNSASGTVSATGSMGGFQPWYAFATEETYDANQYGGYWATNIINSYLQFDFANPIDLMGVGFACYSTVTWKILSSTDGTTYTEIQQITQTQEDTTPTKIDYVLNSVISNCASVRFVYVSGTGGIGAVHLYGRSAGQSLPNRIYYNNTLYADNASGSGGGGGGESGSFIGLSKAEYDALPASEKEDTSKLYLVQEGGGIPITEDLIMTSNDWSMNRQGNMTINWVNSEIVFDWTGGTEIGGNIVKKVAIPATASKIRFKITTGSSYSTTVDRFRVFIGVRTTYQTGGILPYYDTTDWLAKTDFYTNNAVWEDELDLSDVAVDTYLYITAHGWDATVNYLEVVIPTGEEAIRHTYWNNAKWSQWNPVKELTQAEYNALSATDKSNGSIYMTHDGGYDFINYDDGKIVVRVNNSTNETLWFFNGFTKNSEDMTVPNELVPYLPTQTSPQNVIQAKAWTDSTSTTQNGWIGFLFPGTTSVKIRSWSNNGSQLVAGTFWAVLDINGSVAEFGQTAPYSEPTEGLSLLPNRIYYNDTLYADLGNSSGGEIDSNKIVLFEDGQWKNQNIMGITSYLTTLENNKLHCQGMHCGIVVSDVSGMTWGGSYKVIIEVESSNGFSFQIGQCTPTSDLDGIIRAGTNRITYTNDSITDSEHYILKANTIDATRGIFLGGYYLDSSIDYYITKILLEYNNEKEYT